MNTYVHLKEKDYVRNSRERGIGVSVFLIPTIAVILMGLCVFGAFSGRIMLQAKIEKLNKEASSIQSRINKVELEKAALLNRRETLTARPYIMSKIARLGLRPAEYTQINYIKLDPVPSRKKLLAKGQGSPRPASGRYASIR